MLELVTELQAPWTYVYIGPCQALLYHILAPAAAITDYAVGFRKLSANAVTGSFPWCSNGSTFIIDDSSYISFYFFSFYFLFFITARFAYAFTIKPEIV